MIFGIGTDIVEIARIEQSIKANGKFAQRILTEYEFEQFLKTKFPHKYLAKRFAAKEALVKAMGTGIGQGIGWKMCEVRNKEGGQPYFQVSGEIDVFFNQHKLSSFLSISDEQTYACATVVLESTVS